MILRRPDTAASRVRRLTARGLQSSYATCHMWRPRDPGLFIIRGIAWVSLCVYADVIGFVLALLMNDEGLRAATVAIGIASFMALPLAAFGYGLVAWKGRTAWIARVAGWIGMLIGTIPLVSFSFLLLPLTLAASPMLLRWREPAPTSRGRTAP